VAVAGEPEISVRPEARPAERRAIEAALAAVNQQAAVPVRSPWWQAGVRENASDPWLEPPRG
jgi:hypothetical protein